MTRVLNLYGGPCVGKSTLAAGITFMMKTAGYNVELVTEVAKDYVWENSKIIFNNQLYLTTNQYHNMFRLKEYADFIITDAPLLNCAAYFPDDYPDCVMETVKWMHDQFDNTNFYIDRVIPYNPKGRKHSEEESKLVDARIRHLLTEYEVSYQIVDANDNTAKRLSSLLIDRLEMLNAEPT